MIRVHKHDIEPKSLSLTNSYNGQDVCIQLDTDQYNKCYVCERKCITDFETEHLKSVTNFPELRLVWTNLLLSCNYCNRKKSSTFDNILNPLIEDIETVIKQKIDISNKRALFYSIDESLLPEINQTILLLNKVFNGNKRIRTKREEHFFEYILGQYNNFIKILSDYEISPTPMLKSLIIESLTIDQEILGIKYWLIKDNPSLYMEFQEYIIWNKS